MSGRIYQGPFVALWLGGREETIDVQAAWEDEIADVWSDERARGAVGLLEVHADGTRTWRDSAYTEAALAGVGLAPGERVRHCRHPDLVGTVAGFEYQSDGRLSVSPLRVYWDDGGRASDLLGWFFIYPDPDSVEPLEAAVLGLA